MVFGRPRSRVMNGTPAYSNAASFIASGGTTAFAQDTGTNASANLTMTAGANVNFVAFAHFNPAFELEGQVFALFVIVLAAAEAAIALAIVLNFYNNHTTVDVDSADELKG